MDESPGKGDRSAIFSRHILFITEAVYMHDFTYYAQILISG